jgi:hypothetical protein
VIPPRLAAALAELEDGALKRELRYAVRERLLGLRKNYVPPLTELIVILAVLEGRVTVCELAPDPKPPSPAAQRTRRWRARRAGQDVPMMPTGRPRKASPDRESAA